MAYPTIVKILRNAQRFSAIKLLIAQVAVSRPKLKPALILLLSFFSTNNRFNSRFLTASNNQPVKASFRLSDLESDMESFREVGMGDSYRISAMEFEPELVIDGGGNTGLFTLSAFRRWPNAEFVTFEPVPGNVVQIKENLRMNNVSAKIFPFCLGNAKHDTVFYCRQANQGSVSPTEPFFQTIKTQTVCLSEFITAPPNTKCLIKLDIEGAEVDVMEEFLRVPRPCTVVVGELHFCDQQKQRMIDVVHRAGWEIEFYNLGGNAENFFAKPISLRL